MLPDALLQFPSALIRGSRIIPAGGAFLLVPLFIFSCARCSFEGSEGGGDPARQITVVTYNAGNIFDDSDNGSEYREYDPGNGEWKAEHYHARLSALADVLSAVPPKGPDIAALQEIENLRVLADLRDMHAGQLGLKYLACPEASGSAVNTAVISRFPITDVRAHCIGTAESEGLRYILEAHLLADGEPLVIINNHWKSKSGGTEDTEPLRRMAAGLVSRRLAELTSGDPNLDVLVLGDFNENYDEYERIGKNYLTALMPGGNTAGDYGSGVLVLTGEPEEACVSGADIRLYTVWAELEAPGSYAYKRQWETLDNVLCLPGLFDDSGLKFSGARVLDAQFLLDGAGFPLPWDMDSRQGYSDHLPLMVTLEVCRR